MDKGFDHFHRALRHSPGEEGGGGDGEATILAGNSSLCVTVDVEEGISPNVDVVGKAVSWRLRQPHFNEKFSHVEITALCG
ncbi:hypothetical protein CGL52_13775 [Pyrobaculum aerophilum]|uniref:Uncharacterized protein n=1 Tax=Pyrobaculum aerophilum TaxID=13773 RepID=A0A371QWU4_9CREN|nr:hypothetical protein CGL52_13775 [Pyrobaculum aerophilum]